MDKSQMFAAAEKGDLATLTQLLAGESSVDFRNEKGATLLLVAAANGSFESVRFLVERGANVNLADIYDDVPLNRAAVGGHLEIVKFLAEHGALVHSPEVGLHPLLSSAANGNLGVVKYLVEDKGVPVNDMSRYMGSPLQAAAGNGYLEVVRYLVSKGANANVRDSYGMSAIDMVQECMSLDGLSAEETQKLKTITDILKGNSTTSKARTQTTGSSQPNAKPQTPAPKKWWQFWK